jgi:hypothetical protein
MVLVIVIGIIGNALLFGFLALEKYLEDSRREEERRRRLRRRQRWQ